MAYDANNNSSIDGILHWNYRGFTQFPLNEIKEKYKNNVTDIYLKENRITEIPNGIRKLEYLQSLYLSGNKITIVPEEISCLRYLKYLDLSGNRLLHIPECIGDVLNLKYLILDDNNLLELPLSLVELKLLSYLSVCGNKLKYLPQHPVFNYYHCELKFWNNPSLNCLPYTLWLHLYRNITIKCYNIGCLNDVNTMPCCVSNYSPYNRYILIKVKNSTERKITLPVPTIYENILHPRLNYNTVPSLLELTRRFISRLLRNNIKSGSNANKYEDTSLNSINIYNKSYNVKVLDDLCNTMFPNNISKDLRYGPAYYCENIECKMPVYDYVYLDFCTRKITLIDEVREILISIVNCSKKCSQAFRSNKVSSIEWSFLD